MHVYSVNEDVDLVEVSRVEDRRSELKARVFVADAYNDSVHEFAKLLCFLLDSLAVRDEAGLPPATWVEIGNDEDDGKDEDENVRAPGWTCTCPLCPSNY